MKPLIYHHRNQEPGIMLPGMTFTIEPVLCQKSSKGRYWPDGWTIVTADGGRSAQFEHTILITKDGVDILTQLPK
jgi:methionyl aminopeptidase